MQKNIRYIAVDDNPVDLLILKEYAADFPFLRRDINPVESRCYLLRNTHLRIGVDVPGEVKNQR